MKSLRRWQFNKPLPFALELAADARLRPTDYIDDQVWEVLPGSGESPALALQTHYGGRAGLVSLVPMWAMEGRPIYQAQAYASPPTLTEFAPGFLRLQGSITDQLTVQADYWAISSHSVGAQFTLTNTHSNTVSLQMDLIGFVGSQQKELKTSAVLLPDGGAALSLGIIANLQPIVLLEGAQPELSGSSGKLSRTLSITAQTSVVIRVVHAALGDVPASLALAQKTLTENWTAHFEQIDAAAQTIPDIRTGDDSLDLLLAWSYRRLISSFLKPTSALPNASLVATRIPSRGCSPRGDGSDYDRSWNGQAIPLVYPAALATAAVNPTLAQGLIRNYLSIQQPDGWIDARPGLGGQKQSTLCPPILARLTWGIFHHTEDAAFLREVFPGLLKFFERWFKPDCDQDADGLPEWQSETQTSYPFTPTFAAWQRWGQGADIRLFETPDMAAYLLSEARSLKEIAFFLRDATAEQQITNHISKLQTIVNSLWNAEKGYFTYRDRDTHITTSGKAIIENARGTDELLPAETLNPPNRILVKVSGGVNLTPRMTLTLDGLNSEGKPLQETTDASGFVWSGGRGVYTSRHIYAQIDRITFTGLSRAYHVQVSSVDSSALDIACLMPLWSGEIPADEASRLTALLTDPQHFWLPTGVSMNSAKDARFDPRGADGSGAVWPFWLNLMGEALIEHSEDAHAFDLLQRYLNSLQQALTAQKHFSEFFAADAPVGLGETQHLAGIAPLYLLLRSYGVRVVSPTKVWAGGRFVWPHPVTIQHHGILVQRSSEGTRIEFPSGSVVEWAGSEWREVVDQHA